MQNLRERRTAANLSQSTLARKCGCSRTTISLIESGEKIPGADLLRRIEKALDGGSEGGYILPKIPFKSKEEEAEFHRYWCRRYGGDPRK